RDRTVTGVQTCALPIYPRLVPTLAPEMEFKNDGAKSAIDEYFERFRAAGLKVGVCVRPQQIAMVDGKPVHQAAEDEHAVQILRRSEERRVGKEGSAGAR